MSELEAFLRSKRVWTRYKANVKASGRDLNNLLSMSADDGIIYGFFWQSSPEGRNFWYNLFCEAFYA